MFIASFLYVYLLIPKLIASKHVRTLVYTTPHSKDLAKAISAKIGAEMGQMTLGTFSDGEIIMRMSENIEDHRVIIVQSTKPNTNKSIMELLLMISNVKKHGASHIVAVVPYLSYARQDRTKLNGEPNSSLVISQLLQTVGLERLITLDIHSDVAHKFYKSNVFSSHLVTPVIVKYFIDIKLDNVVVVAPDFGARSRAYEFAKEYNIQIEKKTSVGLAMVHKYWINPKASIAMICKYRTEFTGAHSSYISGTSVKDMDVILIDDMIDTGGTIIRAAHLLKRYGAKKIYIFATHGVLSGRALEKLKDPYVERVVLTNSIKQPKDVYESEKIVVLDISEYLANLMTSLQL